MVKYTIALTLLAAASIAAPVPQPGHAVNPRDGDANLLGGSDSGVAKLLGSLTSRNSEKTPKGKNGGILGDVPILGALLGKREVHDLEPRKDILRNLPILGPLLASGDKKERKQKKEGTQHQKKTDASDHGLAGIAGKLPIIRSILDSKADDSDKKRDMDGFSAFLNEATPAMERREEHQHEERQLGELVSKAGLGSLFGGAHHGVGLLPQRRDEEQKHENEARDSPLQGATLVDALFKGGVLGRLKGLFPAK
ncbi:uncharacterized protein PFLUO_LOCUS4009 [Penicillium psychrofluorescens]|uniref:uncharacterized protein n=1 Tax=Penicillium psychrofluorescens TaxID=3158075 RepID=UPI003CCE020F